MFIWHWLLQVTGTHINPATGSSWYNFLSGAAGDLIYLAAFGTAYRKLNCHVDGCRRIGLHKVAGGQYSVCKKHHPAIGEKVTTDHIKEAHERFEHRR